MDDGSLLRPAISPVRNSTAPVGAAGCSAVPVGAGTPIRSVGAAGCSAVPVGAGTPIRSVGAAGCSAVPVGPGRRSARWARRAARRGRPRMPRTRGARSSPASLPAVEARFGAAPPTCARPPRVRAPGRPQCVPRDSSAPRRYPSGTGAPPPPGGIPLGPTGQPCTTPTHQAHTSHLPHLPHFTGGSPPDPDVYLRVPGDVAGRPLCARGILRIRTSTSGFRAMWREDLCAPAAARPAPGGPRRQAPSMRRATAFSIAAWRFASSRYRRRSVSAIVTPSSYWSMTRGST